MCTRINLYQCVMYVNSMEWRIFSFVKPSSFAIFIALDRKFANYFGFRHHTKKIGVYSVYRFQFYGNSCQFPFSSL